MRGLGSLLGVLVYVCLASAEAASMMTEPVATRVRTSNERIRRGLEQGQAQAPTFRALVAELERSSVILHLQPGECTCSGARSCVVFVTASGSTRYLRATVSLRQIQKELVAQIGHELFHATEIARAPQVDSNRALMRFYERRGRSSCGAPCGFETAAAISAQAAVRAELEIAESAHTRR